METELLTVTGSRYIFRHGRACFTDCLASHGNLPPCHSQLGIVGSPDGVMTIAVDHLELRIQHGNSFIARVVGA